MGEAYPEVFTVEELARAARVPREAIDRLIASGDLPFVQGTSYLSAADAVAAGRRIRMFPPQVSVAPAEIFDSVRPSPLGPQKRARSAVYSSGLHVALLLLIMWFTTGPTETAEFDTPSEPTRLVFLINPGPGGGGGGGGWKNPLPPARVQRRGTERRPSVPRVTPKPELTTARHEVEIEKPPVVPAIEPQPIERELEPAPEVVVAPVVTARANPVEQQGVIDNGRADSNSQGPGDNGGAGSGQGSGNGEGLGFGIGDGEGGGTGGGPYRPGSGIQPPRLVREIKAEYTEEARHRGLSGDVVLEIVVRRDGGVGDVTILRGLGAGLDQRAVAAVRQWRFDPARRRGTPVDVIVEVAVQFTLR